MKASSNSTKLFGFVLIPAQSPLKAMLGTTLALLSAAASGISVVMVGRHQKESNAFNVSVLISFVGLLVLWPLAIALTNFGTASLEGLILFGICGMLSPGVVRLFYYGGLKRLGTSVNSSVFSIYPLYTALLAVLLLNEILTLQNLIGVISIILGVFFVEMNFRKTNGVNGSIGHSLIFPVLGGLTYGIATILRKYALNVYDAPVLGTALAYTFSFLPYFVILAFHRPTRKQLSFKKETRLFWAAGVGQAISWILSFYAVSLQEVSVVAPLLAVEPLFVAFFAYFYLREQEFVSAKLAASIVLTVLGVILVTTQFF